MSYGKTLARKMKLRGNIKTCVKLGRDLRAVDLNIKLNTASKPLSDMPLYYPEGVRSPYAGSVELSLKGKLSNSRVTSLSFVRSYSTIIAYGSILDKNMFINNVRCYSKISDRSTDTKAVKVYTDLQNNKVSLIRENKGKSGIYR